MSLPDTLEAGLPPVRRRLDWWVYVLSAVMVVVAVVVSLRLTSDPPKVRAVTVRNETAFEVTMTISATPQGDVTPLGIVPRRGTATFEDVVDQGRTWYVHLVSGGADGGTIIRSRSDLVATGWTLVLDGQADARFRAAGLQPDPNG